GPQRQDRTNVASQLGIDDAEQGTEHDTQENGFDVSTEAEPPGESLDGQMRDDVSDTHDRQQQQDLAEGRFTHGRRRSGGGYHDGRDDREAGEEDGKSP